MCHTDLQLEKEGKNNNNKKQCYSWYQTALDDNFTLLILFI